MFTKAAFQHLRLRFSLLLMPVFLLGLYALVTVSKDYSWSEFSWLNILLAFVCWHLCIYPASNAYNGYQDQDKGSIGDIKQPLKADKSTFHLSIVLNVLGLILALFVHPIFFLFVLIYMFASILYSWRKVRLKQFPIIGFLVIFLFQGLWIVLSTAYLADWFIVSGVKLRQFGLAASFLFGGAYPITQIYQHKQDKEDGVKTISMLLGVNGTLTFSGLMNAMGLFILGKLITEYYGWSDFLIYMMCLLPTVLLFVRWSLGVMKNNQMASFENVMRMTWISAICNNIAILMLILKPLIINWLP